MVDLTGQKFGRLVVLERVENDKRGNSRWLCKCKCKNEIIVSGYNLKSGHTKSCGCLRKELTTQRFTKHGHAKNREETEIYSSWAQIIQRCINTNNSAYKHYGGRGITVCDQWLKFENFLEDMLKDWKPGLTIERKNNNRGYSPDNCYWATRREQQRNTRRNRFIACFGKTQCIAAWAEETGIHYQTLYTRIYVLDWTPEKALTTPVGQRRKKP